MAELRAEKAQMETEDVEEGLADIECLRLDAGEQGSVASDGPQAKTSSAVSDEALPQEDDRKCPKPVAWQIDTSGWGGLRTSRKKMDKSPALVKISKSRFMMTALEAKARHGWEAAQSSELDKQNKRQENAIENVADFPEHKPASYEEIALRKVFDQCRWICHSRPQYGRSCGITSLVSCWNYLFSTLGAGSLPPITQEEALTVLGFQPPFGDIAFGPFTGNGTLLRWFHDLNVHYGVRGQALYFFKPSGRNRSAILQPAEALRVLKENLRKNDRAYIYHCENHYCCPVGFEDVPLKATQAYSGSLLQKDVITWILIADSSRTSSGLLTIKWSDIVKDLSCKAPEFVNIRKLRLGVQQRKRVRAGSNLHCLLEFRRVGHHRPQLKGMAATSSDINTGTVIITSKDSSNSEADSDLEAEYQSDSGTTDTSDN